MIQQPFTKPQANPFNLGKGTYVQRVIPTDTVLLVAQKPVENQAVGTLYILQNYLKAQCR